MPKDIFNKKTRLPKRERTYCSCLLKVREKSKINPYGVCTNSIYNQKGLTRPVVDCSINYKFENIPTDQLKALAKERNLSVFTYNKKTKKRSFAKRKTLIRRLENDIISKKSQKTKRSQKKHKSKSKKN